MLAARVLLTLASFSLGVACAAVAPRAEAPTRPERLVMVVGEKSDAIGVEHARDAERAAVEIAFHDGTRGWVDDWRVRDLEVAPGARLVVRREGALVIATLVERVDRMAWIAAGDAPRLVPIGELVAVLRRSDVVDDAGSAEGPDEASGEAPPPPLDPARVAAYDGADVWIVARIAACRASDAVLVLPDRSEPLEASFDRIAPLAVSAGERVSALWQGTPYPALVTEVRGSMARVQWDDGTDAWMPMSDLRRVQRAPAAASARPRRPAECGRAMTPVLVRLGRARVAGVVEACDETHATLARADGSRERRPREELSALAIAPGDAIDATWRGSGAYGGTVVAIEGSTMRVRWDDGSEEDASLATLLSALEPAGDPRPRAPAGCP